jgi:hypothetical protein
MTHQIFIEPGEYAAVLAYLTEYTAMEVFLGFDKIEPGLSALELAVGDEAERFGIWLVLGKHTHQS